MAPLRLDLAKSLARLGLVDTNFPANCALYHWSIHFPPIAFPLLIDQILLF